MRTITDDVEDIFLELFEDDQFWRLLAARYDSEAVEGSIACDDLAAAKMIRDHAKTAFYSRINEAKLAAVAFSLRVVLRRYGMSRKERRDKAR